MKTFKSIREACDFLGIEEPRKSFNRFSSCSVRWGVRNRYSMNIKKDCIFITDFSQDITVLVKEMENEPKPERNNLKYSPNENNEDSKQINAKNTAQKLYRNAKNVSVCEYLSRKKIPSVDGLMMSDWKRTKQYDNKWKTEIIKNCLIVPIYENKDTICSLQAISPQGEKFFLANGKKKGCYFYIKPKCLSGNPTDNNQSIYVVEGLATGISVHSASNCLVIVAFDAGNILHVCKKIRSHTDREIIIAGDNDDTGINAINLTMDNVPNTKFILPQEKGFDFNDVLVKYGKLVLD